MKRFRFNLETLLKLREKEEEDAKVTLGKEMQLETKLKDDLDEMDVERRELASNQGGEYTHEVAGNVYMRYVRYTHDLYTRIEDKIEGIKAQHQKVEQARQKLIQATQKKKALEILKEKKLEEFKKDEKVREMKFLDDINQVKRSGS